MNKAICEMKNENVDMSVLNGYRQRYEHFGYEPCGQAINFTILDLNINYKLQELIHKEITINLLDENDPIKAYFNFNKDTPSFLNSWLPLPLYIENLDCL